MEYIFEKYRVNGYDYLVFDVNRFQYELSSEKIRKICRHHFGVGIHGIIIGPYITDNSMHVRIFYKDGSEVEKDVNALCAFGLFLKEQNYVYEDSCIINTIGGSAEIELSDASQGSIHVYMEHNCENPVMEINSFAVALDDSSNRLQSSPFSVNPFKEEGRSSNGMICLTGKVRQTGKIITADHFIENL